MSIIATISSGPSIIAKIGTRSVYALDNSDASFSDSISKDTTLDDITVTKNDDSTISYPAAKDIDVGVIDPSESEAVEEMLDNYSDLGTALAGNERIWMTAFVDAEDFINCHVPKDNHTVYSLASPNNLVDYIGRKVSELINSPGESINGFTFGGTNYVKTNFDLSTDGVNYVKNNAHTSVFIQTPDTTADSIPFGVLDGSDRTRLLNQIVNDRLIFSINDAANTMKSTTQLVQALYALERSGASVLTLFKDGVSLAPGTIASSAIPSGMLYVGAQNANGSPDNFMTGTISSVVIGGVLPDQTGHNSNLRALLTGLGVSL